MSAIVSPKNRPSLLAHHGDDQMETFCFVWREVE